jgi:hypothetical protein
LKFERNLFLVSTASSILARLSPLLVSTTSRSFPVGRYRHFGRRRIGIRAS